MSKQSDFTEFYEKSYDKVYRFVRARRFPNNHISDLVSKIFERAWINFDKYLEQGKPDYWVYNIATNVCNYEWRRNKKRGETLSEDVDKFLSLLPSSNKESEIEILAQKKDLKNKFQNLIIELQPKQREVVMMRLEGYTYDEIGFKFGISKQAARKRMLKAIEILEEPLIDFMEKNSDYFR